MAKQGPIVNKILCYIQGIRNTATVRQIQEAVISLFNAQKLHYALLLCREQGVRSWEEYARRKQMQAHSWA